MDRKCGWCGNIYSFLAAVTCRKDLDNKMEMELLDFAEHVRNQMSRPEKFFEEGGLEPWSDIKDVVVRTHTLLRTSKGCPPEVASAGKSSKIMKMGHPKVA